MPTKLSLESEYGTVSIEVPGDDLDIEEMREKLLIPLLLGAGYQSNSVNDLFFDDWDDFRPPSEDDDVDSFMAKGSPLTEVNGVGWRILRAACP